jgi:hypothetical protein
MTLPTHQLSARQTFSAAFVLSFELSVVTRESLAEPGHVALTAKMQRSFRNIALTNALQRELSN